jgi:monoamine oxidase
MQAFGDKQLVDQVLIRLHAFYPQARGAFTGYEIRRSSVDPSTGGAYLAFGPGQISKYWRLWERPLQRVAFAGEHTDSLYPGTLEGALRTGQRAASQVQDLAAGKSFEPVKVAPPKAPEPAAKESSGGIGGFFSNMFGGSKPEPKPAEKAPEPAPAPAPAPAPVTPPPAPVVEPAKPAVVEPAKKAPAKKESTKKEPVKKAPAKPATTHKAPAKTDAAKKAPAKPATDKAATPAAPAADSKN